MALSGKETASVRPDDEAPVWGARRMHFHHLGPDPRGFGRPRGRRRGRGPGFAGTEPGFFGRGAKAARGDVRVAILTLLGEAPMHGYQIIGELEERSGGVWSPSPGSIYPTLQLLEDEGLVRSEQSDGKRIFSLTEAGQEALAARPAGRPAPWDEVGADIDTAIVDLRDAVGQVAAAVRQIAHAGTASQLAAAKGLLFDVRRALYRILAEDEPTDDA